MSRAHFAIVSMAGAEFADAQELTKAELLARIESVTLNFLRAVERGNDPELHLVSVNHSRNYLQFCIYLSFKAARCGSNVVRDSGGRIHLGAGTSTKKLFARKAAGARKVAKSRRALY